MTSWRELGGGTRTRGHLVTAVQRFSGAVSPPCDAGAGSPAPGAPAQHRRRVRTISWEPPSRVATPKLRVGTRNQADPAGCDSWHLRPPPRVRVGGRIMANIWSSAKRSRRFSPSIHTTSSFPRVRRPSTPDGPDQDRERPVSSLTPESSANRK